MLKEFLRVDFWVLETVSFVWFHGRIFLHILIFFLIFHFNSSKFLDFEHFRYLNELLMQNRVSLKREFAWPWDSFTILYSMKLLTQNTFNTSHNYSYIVVHVFVKILKREREKRKERENAHATFPYVFKQFRPLPKSPNSI